ncbi:unnamed protein product [Tilletia laevis]|uniref:Required for respiratory growth protein 9, mitochondrial n=2 Tax=Tilletia TaxID=13289 RepID=A0A177T5F6_9BASI|nr:hypothetical protein CF336_g8718 [Tilletia laevis]KAE8264981.1 hypothetical protein A4X03_0g573 [Tilletia caries]CAD6970844.1 unnamed protein product [Tilletia controversa]KAE8183082.1 hypothetical protein CF335_g8430 [Tilletia laevis]CAD6885299.1 unnamed protein product [Tilletia caries]
MMRRSAASGATAWSVSRAACVSGDVSFRLAFSPAAHPTSTPATTRTLRSQFVCQHAHHALRQHSTSALAQSTASTQHPSANAEQDEDELPWFMQEQEQAQPQPASLPPLEAQQQQQQRHSQPDVLSQPAHLARTPQLQDLHAILTTGSLANLVARPSDLAIYDPDQDPDAAPSADNPADEQPIIFLPTAAIAAALPPHEGAGVAYADWIILIRAHTSAGGALGRLALEVGEFLKRTRPPLSRARSRLEQVERDHGSAHLGADLFGLGEDGAAVSASQEEFAELVIALHSWARKHNLPSPLPPSDLEAGDALGLFAEDADPDSRSLSLTNPVSSLRSARIRRTYRPTPITTISSPDNNQPASTGEPDDLATRGPRPAGWSRIEWDAGRRLPSWGVQKEALRRKLLLKASTQEGDGSSTSSTPPKPFWRPGKILSRSAQDGIRTLHAFDPKVRFSAAELSRAFGISVESVRRILRAGGSRWRASQQDLDDDNGEEGGASEEQRQFRSSTPLSESGAELEAAPVPTSASHVPSWLQRENERAAGSGTDEGQDEESVEQRQERRARERRLERVRKIVERISRERVAMEHDGEEEGSEEIVLDRARDAGAPEHLDREDYETQRLVNRLTKRSPPHTTKSRPPPASFTGEVDLSTEPQREDGNGAWSQPIHYEGLSPAQSTTLSSAAAATSSRPAFQSSRAALPSRTNRAAKGDGDGNWVIVDASWCVVHVLSESGWEKYGPRGGVGSVWREWMGMVERERGWGIEEGMKGKKGASVGVLAKAFGMGEKRGGRKSAAAGSGTVRAGASDASRSPTTTSDSSATPQSTRQDTSWRT